MPRWKWLFKSKNRSASPSQADGSQSSGPPSGFSLPTNVKDVRPQETEVSQLPKRDTDANSTRFFLYDVLCFKGHNIVQRWPQWILETVASWKGTGGDLRDLNGDFESFCPTAAGYARLDGSFKKTMRPDGDCRRQIGRAIESTVKRLKAKEESERVAHRNWQHLKAGSAFLPPEPSRKRTSVDVARRNSNTMGQPSASSAYAPTSNLRTSFHTDAPGPYADDYSTKRRYSLAGPCTSTATSSSFPNQRRAVASNYVATREAPGSRQSDAGLSRHTFSTARTSNSGSMYSRRHPSMYPQYKADVMPLTRENLLQATLCTQMYGQCSTSSTPGKMTWEESRARTCSTHSTAYDTAAESLSSPSATSGLRRSQWNYRDLQRSAGGQRSNSMGNTSYSNYAFSTNSSAFRQHPTERSTPPSRYRPASTRYNPRQEIPPEACRKIMSSDNPSNRKRSGSLGMQTASPPNTIPPHEQRPDSSKAVGGLHTPLNRHHIHSFASRSRSAKTAAADKAAFEKAEYIGFSYQPTKERHEVGLREVERMHGMAQQFRRDSHVPQGPSMRHINPETGRPFATLVETIQVTEALRRSS